MKTVEEKQANNTASRLYYAEMSAEKKARRMEAQRIYRQNPVNREKAREACRKARLDPEKRAKYNNCTKAYNTKTRLDPEVRTQQNEASRIARALDRLDPEKCEKFNEASRLSTAKARLTPQGKHKSSMSSIKSRYCLSEEDFRDLMDAQKGCCAICGTDFGELFRRASVDHCHITGKIRKLLCNKCNTSVGQIEFLNPEHAIEYLEKPDTQILYNTSSAQQYKKTHDAHCELCGRTENLVIDHNHSTGNIRGILCSTCNNALGAVESHMFSAYVQYARGGNCAV